MKKLAPLLLALSLIGCFRPVAYLQNKTHYPVDVFYENQRPGRPFAPLQDLEIKDEVDLTRRQWGNRRMLSRGNNAQQKELMLSRLTIQAKKLGADALVAVRYTYYTSVAYDGYVMTGLAVTYKQEHEASTN